MFFGRDAAASHDLVHFLSARVQVLAASSGAEVCGEVLCGAADVLIGSLELVLVAVADWVARHDKLLQLFVVGGHGHILAKKNRHSESDDNSILVHKREVKRCVYLQCALFAGYSILGTTGEIEWKCTVRIDSKIASTLH